MKILVLGAAGAMTLTIIKDLLEFSEASKIIAADIDYERVKARVHNLADKRLIPKKVDLREIDKVAEIMKEEEVDVTINGAYYEFNINAMQAAMKAKVPIIDLGGLYYCTKEQIKLHDKVKNAGILVIPGMGSDPGTSNVLCRYGADKLDKVEEIHIRYGSNVSNMTFAFAVETIINEATENAIVYENGQYREVPPFSIVENTLFRDPIGELKTYNILHSELATVPQYIEGLRTLTYLDSWDLSLVEKIETLKSLGLLSHKKLKIMGRETTAINLMAEIISKVKREEKFQEGCDSLKVIVKGEEKDKDTSYVFDVMSVGLKKEGITPTSYLTGIPPSIVAQMIAKGEIQGEGVLPPEACIDPIKYIQELSMREIKFFETKL